MKKQDRESQDSKRMRAVLEGIADGVYVTDSAGQIQLWNRAAERLTGVPSTRAANRPCAAVLGLKIDELPLDCSSGCALLASFGPKAAREGVEACRLRRDLRKQPLLVTASEVKTRSGDKEYVHTVRDLTALKQAEEAKAMFLATASHELKTPLTVIIGFTELIRGGAIEGEQLGQALHSIDDRARQLSRIVDRLLLTGRIDAGRLRLALEAVDLHHLIRERAATFAAATAREVHTEIGDGLPAAMGDVDALETVLDHLIDNAIKYSPDGDAIEVHADVFGPHVEIAITDHGIGMDEAQALHCFDRFWQAESTDVRRFGGTGIGLYIVKSLVEAMGGGVRVSSALGTGSTFTVALQRARLATVEQTAEERSKRERGRRSMIEEFMHQIGVPQGGGS